jgi:hypothetical protein
MPNNEVQVQCINKRNRTSPHERIQNIGGINPDGARWKLTEEQAIAGMEVGTWSFYTLVNGRRPNVRVGRHLGRKYLTTEPDGQQPNNLLALPECP